MQTTENPHKMQTDFPSASAVELVSGTVFPIDRTGLSLEKFHAVA